MPSSRAARVCTPPARCSASVNRRLSKPAIAAARDAGAPPAGSGLSSLTASGKSAAVSNGPRASTVARWTGAYQYAVDQVLADIAGRCRALDLRIIGTEEQAKREFAVLLTVHVMNYLHSGGYEVAL